MEQDKAQVAAMPKEKGGNGLKIALVIAIILAIGGIGFGVFEMMQANQKIDEIAELKKNNNKTEEKEENPVDKPSTADNVATTSGPYISGNYFYVPEWGWKFKIPEDLTGIGFSVDYDEAHTGYDLPFIGFTAVQKKDLQTDPMVQYYDNILTCSIISVNKSKNDSNNYQATGYDKVIGDYTLRISDWTANYCDFNTHVDEVAKKLATMFQNPEEI
jgi:hypothetical protein